MTTELRKTGISVMGDIPWGTHFCHFYETKEDLLDILIPYFRAGLENNEFCVWVVAEPVPEEEAREALRRAVPEADRYLAEGRMEIIPYQDWFPKDGAFDPEQILQEWNGKLVEALARGYAGLRGHANVAWMTRANWKDFSQVERALDEALAGKRMIILCSYPLAVARAAEIFNVVETHQFAVVRRKGRWEVVESPELKQAKTEIKRLNEELEQRVFERTRELADTNEELKKEIIQRKRIEEALRESEERFRRTFISNPTASVIFSFPDGRFLNVNDAFVRTFGHTPEEAVGKTSVELGLWPDPQEREELLRRAREGEEVRGYETRLRTKSGVALDVLLYMEAIELAGAQCLLATISDITERKRAEELLRARERHFRALIENSADAFLLFTPDGRLYYASPSTPRVIGYSPEEIASLNAYDILHPQDVEVFEGALAAILGRPGASVNVQLRVRQKDGAWHWFEGTYTNMIDDPNIGAIVNNFRNITERKRAEEHLRQAEEQARKVLDTIPAMIGSGPPDGTLDYCNQQWLAFSGLTLKQLGSYQELLTHPDDRERVFKKWQETVAIGKPYEMEQRHRRFDGVYRWFLTRGVPLRDSEGRIERWYGTLTDIEDRKQAEEQLKATSEQLRALSASLQSAREEESTRIAREIHDELGASLSSLRWDLEEVDEVISKSTDVARLADLRKKIADMMRLTDTTVNSVRRIASELRPAALDDLGLVEAIEWQAEQFQERAGITVNCDFYLEGVDLSREQSTAIFRIFQEALTNIRRHAGADRVDVTLKEKAGELVMQISDNGRGITEDEKTGSQTLGLLGMRERANLIGGDVAITGSEGKGTTVTLRVPITG